VQKLYRNSPMVWGHRDTEHGCHRPPAVRRSLLAARRRQHVRWQLLWTLWPPRDISHDPISHGTDDVFITTATATYSMPCLHIPAGYSS